MKNSSPIQPREVFQFRKAGDHLFEWKVPAELPYFDGHFPGNPILPGIAMIDAGLEVLRLVLGLEDAPFVKKIHSAKFTALIRPGDQVELNHELRDQKQRIVIKKADVQVADLIFEI